MKTKLTIAFVTLILLFTSSLTWAQDITPFQLITVTPKSSDNQNIKYSVTFTNTAKKIHLEVPAIYSTDEINASTPPFAKNLDKISFTVKLKRISPTGIASYTTIGKYKYVIPVINNPGAYSKALVDFSNQVGFTIPTIDFSVLPQNDLLLSDLYAKNFLEQITGSVINEADLKYDSNSYSSSSSYQVISASGVVTNYKSSKGIGNFIPQFIKDFDLKGFVNNSKNIKKIGVLAGIGSIFDNDNESGINSGLVSDAYSSPAPIIARGSLIGLFVDTQVNRIDAEDENPDNPNLDQLDEEFDETAKFLGDPQKTHLLIPDVTGTIAKIKDKVQKISDKISTRFGNVANKVTNTYDWAKDFINSLNSTDFDKNKIQNALNNEEIDPVTPQTESTSNCVQPEIGVTYSSSGCYNAKGNKTGIWTSYTNGNVVETTTYSDGVQNGAYSSHYPGNNYAYEGAYADGKKNGVWNYYDHERLSDTTTYVKGDKTGAYNSNYPGNIFGDVGEYVDGKKNGVWTQYYYGEKNSTTTYSNGVANGAYSSKYSDKTTFSDVGEYVDGKKNGVWTQYYYGEKNSTTTYSNGVANGAYSSKYSDKTTFSDVGEYVDGKKNGVWTQYYYGKINSTTTYSNGVAGKTTYVK